MKTLVLLWLLYFQVTPPFESLIVDFVREYNNGPTKERSSGKIYYHRSGKLVINVTDPLEQIMVFSEKTLVIYYPEDKRAFQIESEMPFSLPFVSALIGSFRPNYGLDDMGYKLEHTERKGDTLISHWNPPNLVRPILGKSTLVEHKRTLIYAESRRASGEILTSAVFRDHMRKGNLILALHVETNHFHKEGVEIERLWFKNPEFNKPLPDSLMNFQIPAGTPTKNVKWW